MDRRRLLSRLGVYAAVALLGSGTVEAVDVVQNADSRSRRWASTIEPDPRRGSVHVRWSADTSAGRLVALTFDDGPTEQFTAHVLDVLAAADASATFFVVGALVERHADLVRRVRDAGHEIANHSYDHVSAASGDRASVRTSVLRGTDAIETVTGARPRWFRPPRGEVTTATLLAVQEAGLDLAFWSVNRGDAADPDSAGVRRHLSTAIHPGAVVDLHDGIGRSAWVGSPDDQLIVRRRAEVAALPAVLADWRAQGYRLTTLSRLIPEDRRST